MGQPIFTSLSPQSMIELTETVVFGGTIKLTSPQILIMQIFMVWGNSNPERSSRWFPSSVMNVLRLAIGPRIRISPQMVREKLFVFLDGGTGASTTATAVGAMVISGSSTGGLKTAWVSDIVYCVQCEGLLGGFTTRDRVGED